MVFRAPSISSIIGSLADFNHWFAIFSTNSRSELEKLVWFCYQISSLSPKSWKIIGSHVSYLLTPFSGTSLQICPCQVISHHSPLRQTCVNFERSLDPSSKALFLWGLNCKNDLSEFRGNATSLCCKCIGFFSLNIVNA